MASQSKLNSCIIYSSKSREGVTSCVMANFTCLSSTAKSSAVSISCRYCLIKVLWSCNELSRPLSTSLIKSFRPFPWFQYSMSRNLSDSRGLTLSWIERQKNWTIESYCLLFNCRSGLFCARGWMGWEKKPWSSRLIPGYCRVEK